MSTPKMPSHQKLREFSRNAPNTANLLDGGEISYHCANCGEFKFGHPNDVGSARYIRLFCDVCAAEQGYLDRI
jgi:hypothetical protein